jgi:neutral ceramidase
VALAAGCAYVVASVDWRPRPRDVAPAILVKAQAEPPLVAGAARVALEPSLPVVRAGYSPPRPVALKEHDPIELRALTIEGQGARIALVLGDLLEVPSDLIATLASRLTDLHLNALIVAATHTHSSLGAFDSRLLAQLAGTGRYNASVERHIVDRMEAAVRRAAGLAQPVTVQLASGRLTGVIENRDAADFTVDDRLTVLTLRGPAAPVATVGVFSEHPTTFPRQTPELSGDIPGEVMRRLDSSGGVSFLLQGAVGDATVSDPPDAGVSRFDFAASSLVQAIGLNAARATVVTGGFSYVEAEVELPPPSADAAVPGALRRPAANFLGFTAPRTARVGVLCIGPAMFLLVPGEPTGAAADALERRIAGHVPADSTVRVVGLAQGYIGYVETPDRVKEGVGESRRTYYGPQLVGRLGDGFVAAVAASAPTLRTPRQ